MPITIRTASPQSVVNTELRDHQMYSHATALADGGFVVAWASDGQDGVPGCTGTAVQPGGCVRPILRV